MSMRPQQSLGATPQDRVVGAVHEEVLAEMAASLGRAGKTLETRLARLKEAAPEEKDVALRSAAEAAHHYFIQRELCGLRDHRAVIKDYAIPGAVLARMGAK